VTTDAQRRLLGYVREPAADASLSVLVNYAAFANEELDSSSPVFRTLAGELAKFAKQDDRFAKFRVLVGDRGNVPFDQVRDKAHSLAQLCATIGRAAGYQSARWSTSFGGWRWDSHVNVAEAAARAAKSKVEDSVGDHRVRVYPVRTFLSRLETDADCVVDVIPELRAAPAMKFPDDFVAAMAEFIPQIKYENNQKLLIRVRVTESAQKPLDEWVSDREARSALARRFGFQECSVSQSYTDDTPDAPRTDAITGQVLNSDGTAAAGVLIYAHSMTNPDRFTSDDDPEPAGFQRGQTDANGRFTLDLYPAPNALLWILPQDYSQQTIVLNERRGDLGTFELKEGIRLHGSVVADDGSPIPNAWVNANLVAGPAKQEFPVPVADQIRRSALSDGDGRFTLGRLPPCTYRLEVDESADEYGKRREPRRPLPSAFRPRQVEVSAASELDEFGLRAVDSVTLEVRFVDSQGQPAHGNRFYFIGRTPDGARVAFERRQEDREPVVFTAPPGLDRSILDFPTSAMRVPRAPDEPSSKNTAIYLGRLDRDWREITVLRYKAPVLLVDASDSEGNRVAGAKVTATYSAVEPSQPGYMPTTGARFQPQKDGRWRSEFLLPDEEFTLTVTAPGYEPFEETMSLPEGKLSEVDAILNKIHAPGSPDGNSATNPPKPILSPSVIRNGKLIDESGRVLPATEKTLLRSYR
jgi:hypothetical protein